MKVAVTAQDDKLTSEVDPRFGRAKYFIVIDTETGEWRATDNGQNLHSTQGAGIQAAGNTARLGADVVLTGHCGPKAFRTLAAAGIKVCTGVDGTVQDALKRLEAGELSYADDANVEGHWA